MQTHPLEFYPSTQDIATVLLPVPSVLFADRAARFAALADGHSLSDWLRFLGRLTTAQHMASLSLPGLSMPDADTLEQARDHGMPPLNASALPRPPVWREVLRQLVQAVAADAPQSAGSVLNGLMTADDARLEALADLLLTGVPQPEDAATLPFVAAALQVVFTTLASQLDVRQIKGIDAHGVCPVCGSLAVCSIVRLGAVVNNLRYLHCSLCNTEWNLSRATCTTCNTDKGVALQELDGSNGAVRAETCDHCKSYLKMVYQEKDPLVDPVADDLATLALDILVDEAGYTRSGPNLLLFS